MHGRAYQPPRRYPYTARHHPSHLRNLGGKFDLGWPHMDEVLANYIHEQTSTGRRVLLLITYHYSKGDKHRGGAGFNYDTEAARAFTYSIKKQVEHVFGAGHGTVYPIVCGFETDEEALVLHGSNGKTLDISALTVHDQYGCAGGWKRCFQTCPARSAMTSNRSCSATWTVSSRSGRRTAHWTSNTTSG